jgi:3-phosphoglycerate kinase
MSHLVDQKEKKNISKKHIVKPVRKRLDSCEFVEDCWKTKRRVAANLESGEVLLLEISFSCRGRSWRGEFRQRISFHWAIYM